MTRYTRFAVYYAPPDGAFADWADAWLGWSARAGLPCPQPVLHGLPVAAESITRDPRKYGFHGTIRAPFRLADGIDLPALIAGLDSIAAGLAPVVCDGLRLANLDGFLALTPTGDSAALTHLAAEVVRATNPLRAPLTEAEVARRRPATLTPRQRDLLRDWGYPFVMEEFQFHLTLTDRLEAGLAARVAQVLETAVGPLIPQPFRIDDLCLFGEDEAGRFHLLHRAALTGADG